jgi:hypothetical protein
VGILSIQATKYQADTRLQGMSVIGPVIVSYVANAQSQRKKVEALFAELKNQIGLRRLRLRRLKFVREQFFLAAAAQNIKRLVRFLSQGPRPMLAATT